MQVYMLQIRTQI